MKKHLRSMWTLGAFATLLTVGITLNAQQSTPTSPSTSTDPATAPQSQPTQPTDPTAQQPSTPTQAQPSQAPDQGGQAAPSTPSQPSATATDSQTFSGTIVKAGDKYVLQDAASGKSYDIDHQDQVKQYEGKKVRVHGTLDANGKIHLQ
jgi:cytoskeletal protein RodZ